MANEYDKLLAPVVSGNPYDDALRGERKQTMRVNMMTGVDANPDTEARVQDFARRYNLPAEAVRLELPQIERRAKVEALDYDTLARLPATAMPVVELTAESVCTGRGGRALAVLLGAQDQPAGPALQSYCSAAKTLGLASGCIASRLPVTSSGNFLRKAGDLTAILLVRASCAYRPKDRTPLDGLKKMQDNKA